ncbi:orotidine 5'-phosphate decarboxylase [Micromonospora sp. STR1s_5]|nr:orotidine 5'-phosphate decarboxylase [Micromonospora sp. STR1s_5]
MGRVVARWSGLEARALREAMRMSVREFAAHLGVNVNSVSAWEKRGALAQLRFETQQLLDTALAQLDEDGHRRFQLMLNALDASSTASNEILPDGRTATGQPEDDEGRGDQQGLAHRSVQRTSALVSALTAGRGQLAFIPADGVADRLRQFLESTARVFVVKGPPGSGKTTMIGHLTAELSEEIDSQIHTVDSWPLGQLDLPSQILRYASVPAGDDSLLTLEQQTVNLSRALLVAIDGIFSREQLHEIGRQLDRILRHITDLNLRFVLVMRTPPDLELTGYPVLAASVYEPDLTDRGTSCRIIPWRPEQARRVWDAALQPGQPVFADLPNSLQKLATLPLYLTLLRSADMTDLNVPSTAFRLVGHCVQSILGRSDVEPTLAVEMLSDLALRQSDVLLPQTMMASLSADRKADRVFSSGDLPPLVILTSDGPRFAHDVIGEYFAADRIADLIARQGRSVASVNTLNDLAEQSISSASARGIFDFVVSCIDERAPDLAAAIALSPTISVDTTLPLMLRVATPTMRLAQVLQSSASRCDQPNALELTRALLSTSALAGALDETYSEWVISVLRTFGPEVWPDVLSHLEQTVDAAMATQLLKTADLERGEEATFFARHATLFHGISSDQWLEALVSHADWRVRAALADGVLDESSHHYRLAVAPVIQRLVADEDYKVRAVVAKAITRAELPTWKPQIQALAADANWHVRASLLHGLLSNANELEASQGLIAGLVAEDERWRGAPADAARLRHRLLLLSDIGTADRSIHRARALFGLLREVRTNWKALPPTTVERLLEDGRQSPEWIVRREAEAIRLPGRTQSGIAGSAVRMARREDFRRLRGNHAVQVALDLHDLDHALDVARALAEAGVQLIEVGDPLIKQAGVRAIEEVKRVVGTTSVVAEMMSADWGRDQVEQAAEAGADVVLLIGPATGASVSAAVEAGRRLDTPILLDIPTLHASQQWVGDMERAGVDGFTITSNIDIGIGVGHPLARARAVRSWTRLPVGVSGGFSVTDLPVLASRDWDILIVGRSITEAIRPKSAIDQLLKTLDTQQGRRRHAHHRS